MDDEDDMSSAGSDVEEPPAASGSDPTAVRTSSVLDCYRLIVCEIASICANFITPHSK